MIVELMGEKMQQTGKKVLWGTANCFSNKRYMSGASTNPDPEVFAYTAAQIKKAMDVTAQLGGENYVLWGGREGYETLLNTDMGRELDNMGRMLSMVAEYKHKIGFKGRLLIEPKPKEPTKHQYDFDTATVFGFLKKYGLEKEFQVNIEANHAILSGHSFQHEVETALAHGIFGSLDMNRGDPQLGWDTDQFPVDLGETALILYTILSNGGMGSGGMNFDAKLRRQSIDPEDLFHAHISGMDTLARGLLAAEAMINDGKLKGVIDQRYAGWKQELGQKIEKGTSLEELSDYVLDKNVNPKPRSGRQEALEALVNQYL
jgi:xylose isomerase